MQEWEAVAFRWRGVDMSDWKATRLTRGLRTLVEHFEPVGGGRSKPARAFQGRRRR